MPNTDGCHPLKYRKTLIRYFIRKRSKYWEKTAIQDYYITKITKYDNIHGHRIIKEK